MVLGTLKLDTDNVYVYDDGDLPYAPVWDKEWLRQLVRFNTVSEDGYDILPPSIQKDATISFILKPQLAIKIPEIAKADILIVTRVSSFKKSGKKFRFDNFIPITSTGQIEIWRRL